MRMVMRVLVLVCLVLSLCQPVHAGYSPRRKAPTAKEIATEPLCRFVAECANAIRTGNRQSLIDLLHPECRAAMKNNEDVGLFLDCLMSKSEVIPDWYTWMTIDTNVAKQKARGTRYVVPCKRSALIEWRRKGPNSGGQYGFAVGYVKQGDSYLLVSQMSDSLAERMRKQNAGKKK